MITAIKKPISAIKERDPITSRIIACAYKVHSELGPGFNEKIYHNALKVALEDDSLNYETEKEYKVIYQDKRVGTLKIDLLVEGKIIVEIKAITGYIPKVFEAQVLSYLKITTCEVGLLINFGNKSCQIRRLMFESL
ncbi:MAG: GxxExxY protein [Candidatus Ratteibacteria bacterium]|nr:GxxExxY protein [Candidatus Ratteibacteria bacterium]